MIKTTLLKIGKIAGMYYECGRKTNTIVVFGLGAPVPPDDGTLPEAQIILKRKIDLFVPDYIGYGRSDGTFTPENCIKTFLSIYNAFKKGTIGKNYYSQKSIKLKYKRIIFIGRSFAGAYIPILPKYEPSISELAIISPVVDSKSCGSITGEESNKDFLRSMKHDGYHHLYRGILTKRWKNHLENKDDLSPVDNIKYLKNAKLFIAHGKNDTCVHFSKSEKYFKKICAFFSEKRLQFKLKLYPDDDHTSARIRATEDFLNWIRVD